MTEDSATDGYFVDTQIARMLGVNAVTVRQWRVKNKKLGRLRYGPPYEYRGGDVVYPKSKFREWCAAVEVIGGVPHANLPPSADVAEIQRATASTGETRADAFAEIRTLGR